VRRHHAARPRWVNAHPSQSTHRAQSGCASEAPQTAARLYKAPGPGSFSEHAGQRLERPQAGRKQSVEPGDLRLQRCYRHPPPHSGRCRFPQPHHPLRDPCVSHPPQPPPHTCGKTLRHDMRRTPAQASNGCCSCAAHWCVRHSTPSPRNATPSPRHFGQYTRPRPGPPVLVSLAQPPIRPPAQRQGTRTDLPPFQPEPTAALMLHRCTERPALLLWSRVSRGGGHVVSSAPLLPSTRPRVQRASSPPSSCPLRCGGVFPPTHAACWRAAGTPRGGRPRPTCGSTSGCCRRSAPTSWWWGSRRSCR
jgi:hypothetical protein